MSIDQLSSNNNVQTEEQESDKVFDSDEPRPWFPMGDLKNLPTEIYSDCMLSKVEHQKILCSEPHNAEVDFKPLQIEQYFLQAISKQQKEFDKIIRNISYRTSAVLQPIDNIEKALSKSKPDNNDLKAKMRYDLLRKSNQILENYYKMPYHTQMIYKEILHLKDKKGVFGNKLKDVVEEEIGRSKLYNNANKEKHRFFISNPPNQPQ
ncbi:43328_t:CDS:2 [Gigaspora margarita]|uniref:43328_t:CDS:1 n=1 Tax=Gigaspora margarita TaxID=4874 RepID=A0ABN7V7T8_GIGMA|nr:43328_t:CDS:2 [Gigaspora margarita]